MKKPRKELYLFITYPLKLRTEHCHFLDSVRMWDVNRNSQLIEHFDSVLEKSESQVLNISHTIFFVHNFLLHSSFHTLHICFYV